MVYICLYRVTEQTVSRIGRFTSSATAYLQKTNLASVITFVCIKATRFAVSSFAMTRSVAANWLKSMGCAINTLNLLFHAGFSVDLLYMARIQR
jgi:hypothetical protein